MGSYGSWMFESRPLALVECTAACGHAVSETASDHMISSVRARLEERVCKDCRTDANKAAAAKILAALDAAVLPPLDVTEAERTRTAIPDTRERYIELGYWARSKALDAVRTLCLHGTESDFFPADAVVGLAVLLEETDAKMWRRWRRHHGDAGYRYLMGREYLKGAPNPLDAPRG